MYNKSPRFGIQFPYTTPPEVGPYTYMLDDPLQVKRVNVVPFLSTAERKNAFAQPTYCNALYNSRMKENIVGGHSLRNTAKRFVYKVSDVPPPGTYDPKIPGKCKRPSNEPPPGKGRLYFCKVPYSIIGSAPSIPTKRDENGYDIGRCGRLIKNKATSCEKIVGPATYYINVSSCANDDPYRGCRWSGRTSLRETYKIIASPGPGHYDVEKVATCRRDPVEEEYREMARRFSYLPRYLEQQQCMAIRRNYPSPCQYNKPSCFDYKPPVTTILKPFINKKPRFQPPKQQEGVIYDTSVPIGNRPTPSVKEIPFSIGAERFDKKIKPENEPEPGFFHPKGFADRIIEKNSKPYSLFKPPFDSTVDREINFVAYDSHLKPDCALYPREEPPLMYQVHQGNSVFVSTTGRSKSVLTAAPPVTKYAISEPFNKNRNPTSHNKKKLPFSATSERKTVILPQKENPGPADYVGKEGIKGNGFVFDHSKRFSEKESFVPPPDHYYIHPLYQESIYAAKNTFNLMIAESILKKKLRVPPKDTFRDYIRILKKKKKLRCYSTILDQ